MKKLFCLMLVALLCLGLCACGGGKTETPEETQAPETEKKQWDIFLEEYEAWVDEYIDLMKKYKANPGDADIMVKYTEMVSKLEEWPATVEFYAEKLKGTDYLDNFSKEAARIAAKLTQG